MSRVPRQFIPPCVPSLSSPLPVRLLTLAPSCASLHQTTESTSPATAALHCNVDRLLLHFFQRCLISICLVLASDTQFYSSIFYFDSYSEQRFRNEEQKVRGLAFVVQSVSMFYTHPPTPSRAPVVNRYIAESWPIGRWSLSYQHFSVKKSSITTMTTARLVFGCTRDQTRWVRFP